MKKIPDGCIEVPLEEVDYIYQPPQSHTPVIVMKQKLPPMQSRVLECMKCGSKKNLNTNKDKSFVECDECMWGIEKDGTRLADEFYSLAPRYRTKVKLQEMIDKWLDKAREEGDIASDFLYWHPLGGGMPDSSIRIGVEFEVGGCYEDWGFVIEQNGRKISSGRTLKEAISKLKDSK